MSACNGNRGFIAVRNYHTDLLWNYENFKRVAAVPRCSCGLETLPRCCPGAEHSAPRSPRAGWQQRGCAANVGVTGRLEVEQLQTL